MPATTRAARPARPPPTVARIAAPGRRLRLLPLFVLPLAKALAGIVLAAGGGLAMAGRQVPALAGEYWGLSGGGTAGDGGGVLSRILRPVVSGDIGLLMRLHLIRHPKPLIESGICYGRLDCPAEDVPSVADTLLAELPQGLPVWTSPLRRCHELATCCTPGR